MGTQTLSGNVRICFFNAGKMDLLLDVPLIAEVSMIVSPVFEEPLVFSEFASFLWNIFSSMLAIT
jgi:hypothetical protein